MKVFFSVLIFSCLVFAQIPQELKYEILFSLPHNNESFTQGLLILGDKIYESTGAVGRGSYVLELDKTTGEEIRKTKADGIFGEGLAFDGVTLWQLSWQEEKAFVYGLNSLAKIAEVPYKGEGWGLTYIKKDRRFAMSNGSDKIIFRDQDFNEFNSISVKFDGKSLDQLNELEFWNNQILANKWYSDTIYAINYETGAVENFIDLTKLRESENPSIRDGNVLNGIAAIDSETLLITGKRWNKYYIIKVIKTPSRHSRQTFQGYEYLPGGSGKLFRATETFPASPAKFSALRKPSRCRRQTFQGYGNLPGIAGKPFGVAETFPVSPACLSNEKNHKLLS
jgi:glutamine cyclotransferase